MCRLVRFPPTPPAREFRAFLNTVEARVPADLAVNMMIDKLATHKTKAIRGWFARQPKILQLKDLMGRIPADWSEQRRALGRRA